MKKNIEAIIFAVEKPVSQPNREIPYAEPLCGQPMILYAINALKELSIPTKVIYHAEHSALQNIIRQTGVSAHESADGTSDSIMFPSSLVQAEHVLIFRGNSPFITHTLLAKFIKRHLNSVHCMSAIEQSEIYLLERSFLTDMQKLTKNDMFDMTELLIHAYRHEIEPNDFPIPRPGMARGVYTCIELAKAEQAMRKRLIREWTKKGVRFTCGQSTYLDTNIHIGSGSLIEEGVRISDGSRIGIDCTVGAYARLSKTVIGDHTTILPFSVIHESNIGDAAHIGPFAHLQQATVAEKSVIGNFVEVKRSSIGSASKAKHLAYIGDTQMGSGVNVGAGTVICNYDGMQKHTTVIENNAFIGSNNTLIAPITVEENSYTAAGSTITQDVPRNSLAIARSLQLNKLGYADRILKKEQKTSKLKKRVDADLDAEKNRFVGAKRTTHDPTEPDLL